MAICALCKTREADKVGSHVVPAFMLVSLIGKRNKEIGFQISSKGFVKKYIGREVSTKSIVDVLDRELTEEDISTNENLFTVDNLICIRCEARIALLEGLCSEEIKAIHDSAQNAVKGKAVDSFELENSSLIRLLFYSILFRLGAAAKFEYNLNVAIYSRLRLLLDKVLSTEKNDIIANLDRFGDEINSIPFSLFYAPFHEDSSGNQIYPHKPLSIPSLVMVNEFIVCTYNSKQQTHFDFGKVFSITPAMVREVMNFKESKLRIGLITTRDGINEALVKDLTHHMYRNLSGMYEQISVQTTGKNPAIGEVKAFMDDLIEDETQAADKYNPQFIAKKMLTHLTRKPESPQRHDKLEV